jgi:hypothetical protein
VIGTGATSRPDAVDVEIHLTRAQLGVNDLLDRATVVSQLRRAPLAGANDTRASTAH